METFTSVTAKFVSKASSTAKANEQKINSIQANVDLLVADLSEKKQRREERACKRAELKRKRSEDHDDDPQKGEKEPTQKKSRTETPEQRQTEQRQTDASASEVPKTNPEAQQTQSTQVPLYTTPLNQFSGPLPKDPDTAKFLLNLLGKTKISTTPTPSVAKPAQQPSAPAQSPTPVTEPSVPEPSFTTEPEVNVPEQEENVNVTEPEIQIPESAEEQVKEPVAEQETLVPESELPRSEPKDKAPAAEESSKPKSSIQEQLEKEKIRLDRYRLPTLIEVTNAYRYAQTDTKVFLMMPNFANDYNVSDSIKERFMAHNLMREEAFSKSAIKKITGVKHVQFEQTEIMYSIYEVLRDDNNTQYFCDNDLLNINPSDLVPLGRRMKQKMKEGRHPQDKVAFERILRCMEAFVKHRRQVDFQIGLDHNVTDLSIAAPNEALEGIDRLIVGTLVEKPEEGVVFRRPGKKCFFRVKDAYRYSNSIIDIVKGNASLQMGEGNTEERLFAEKIFKKLDNLKKLRILTGQFHKIVTRQPDALF